MSEKVLFGLATSEVIDQFNVVVKQCGSLNQAITHLLNKDRLLRTKYRFQQPTNCVVWEVKMDERRDNLSAVLQMLDSYVRFNRLDSRSAALEELLQAAEVEKEQPMELPPGDGALEQCDQSTQTIVDLRAKREMIQQHENMMRMLLQQQQRGQNDVSSQTNLVLLQHASVQTATSTPDADHEVVKKRRKRGAPQKKRMTVSSMIVTEQNQILPPGAPRTTPVKFTSVTTPPFMSYVQTPPSSAEDSASGISIASIRSLAQHTAASPIVQQRLHRYTPPPPMNFTYPFQPTSYPGHPHTMLYSQPPTTAAVNIQQPKEWKGAACGDVANNAMYNHLSAKTKRGRKADAVVMKGEFGGKKHEEEKAVHDGSRSKRMRKPPTFYQAANNSIYHRITQRERRWLRK